MLTAEIIRTKFNIRELVIFLINKRQSVILDNDVVFTYDEYYEYQRQNNIKTNSNEELEKMLIYLGKLKQRTVNMKLIRPITPLLTYHEDEDEDEDNKFVVDVETTTLQNALRYIDILVYLEERPEEYEDKSLFDNTQDNRVIFFDKITPRALELKERAIFRYLLKHFNRECDYIELFKAVLKIKGPNNNLRSRYRLDSEKRDYINNGIRELRKKLFALSNNKNTIVTSSGRQSKYTLIY